MIHSTHFMLWSYSLAHMVKDCSDSKKGNLLLSHGLLFPISSKGSFIICKHPRQDSTYHDIWIEQEIAQLDRSDYPSHYEWMLYHRATSRSVHKRCLAAKQRVTNEVAAVSFLFFIRVVLYHAWCHTIKYKECLTWKTAPKTLLLKTNNTSNFIK